MVGWWCDVVVAVFVDVLVLVVVRICCRINRRAATLDEAGGCTGDSCGDDDDDDDCGCDCCCR